MTVCLKHEANGCARSMLQVSCHGVMLTRPGADVSRWGRHICVGRLDAANFR